MHETVTWNHCCQYMWQLLKGVEKFINSFIKIYLSLIPNYNLR
ncbi:hypothetical protein XBKQ1_1380006 [Xenorhabdus bovienii str. kraussei Quebec]|uniref:Uncharacterized protein n=2 Tax=Xenorhabdus bovienii TaxID=40576 RepID=A0A077PC72_XENBV|nr:hypothetical protein XBKQ1_1380006 [Xenorhabdus bovienii str. kraussei Quebec]CDH30929.1 hypothetical protein XBI1_1150057 [Xenorhabdus bovienii str. Intermedium]